MFHALLWVRENFYQLRASGCFEMSSSGYAMKGAFVTALCRMFLSVSASSLGRPIDGGVALALKLMKEQADYNEDRG